MFDVILRSYLHVNIAIYKVRRLHQPFNLLANTISIACQAIVANHTLACLPNDCVEKSSLSIPNLFGDNVSKSI